ncbi:MAG: 23S rRNA (adenine(2030)-N(6))-methyltransferase RlmJ [Ancalomicrobiaceae bacterium]|nr:23S rRNA (adenine(2030)-N(6))-methyltransferase RlmJ [Ancalomicrobiaceae bacterium]
MNYRHAYHAGNFADVFKHAILTRIVLLLQKKQAAFRYIDSHAGAGLYDLTAPGPAKTGEWKGGIGRLLASNPPAALAELVQPYLDAISFAAEAPISASKPPRRYPGSPAIVRYLARRQDRLTLTELHPEDRAELADRYAGDIQVKVIELDGWLALKSFLPPKERRGLVLIDPPFEAEDEFDRSLDALVEAHRRFSTGVYMLWYPVKDLRQVRRFKEQLAASGIRRILAADLFVRPPTADGTLAASGLIIVNPPYTLDDELRRLVPGLVKALSQGPGASGEVSWLVGE